MNRRHFVAGAVCGLAGNGVAVSLVKPPLLIDSHVHVWARDARFPFAAGAKVPEGDFSAERLLELMAANGVARTVLIQVIHYRWDNRYLADVLRRYSGKFQVVCRVDPESERAADDLSRRTQEGFRGVRLSPAAGASGDWIRGPKMPPLWHRCAELKVPMTVLAPATRMPDLMPLIEKNPELTVVIDHMADARVDEPKQLEMVLALARFPRVFVKISHAWAVSRQAYPYADAMEQIRRLRDGFGAERLMWGTDWPVSLAELSYEQAVALYRDHLGWMTEREREWVLSGTVQRVWPFGLR
jgi:predicted TIM-barrel fold metal-dependent hydrolase